MDVSQNGRREHFPLIKNTFCFKVWWKSDFFFLFFSSLLISLLGIQVTASLVFQPLGCTVSPGSVLPCPPAGARPRRLPRALAANCWEARRSGSRSSSPLYLWPWPRRGTPARNLCLPAPGGGLWSPAGGRLNEDGKSTMWNDFSENYFSAPWRRWDSVKSDLQQISPSWFLINCGRS